MKQLFSLLWLGLLASANHLSAQCEPVITTYNGLCVNLLQADIDGDGMTDQAQCTIQAADLLLLAPNPCAAGPLDLRIRKAGTGTGAPATTSVAFDCNELGTQLVEIWAGDASTGVWNYTNTYVIVQDGGACSQSPLPTACGASDQLPPALQVFNGLAASLVPNGAGAGTLKFTAANLRAKVSDNCAGPIRLRLRRSGFGSGVPATSSVTFDCNDLGIQPVEVWAGDGSGNWTSVETYVLIDDANGVCGTAIAAGCAPDLTVPDVQVYNGLAACIAPTASGGAVATVRAKPFLRQRSDNCVGTPLMVRISREGETTTPPTTSSLNFSCDELGTQLVRIWVGDAAGNWSQTLTYVIIQDNLNLCGIGPAPELASVVPGWKPALPTRTQAGMNPSAAANGFDFSIRPNPTSGSFTVNGVLENADFARFDLYNNFGQKIKTLAERQWLPAGEFRFDFETGGDLPAGLYRCVMQTDGATKTMALVKN